MIDRTGERYGSLVAIKEAPREHNKIMWECRCDCGNTIIIRSERLYSGIKSCGCIANNGRIAIDKKIGTCFDTTTHGMSNSDEYHIWAGLMQRCYNPKRQSYRIYGGRGIYVCRRWKKDFIKFYNDIGDRPSKKHSIERIDNNGPYAPWNCKWATIDEQSNNRRSNTILYCWGMSFTMKQWAERLNINYKTLNSRINQYNWDTERALTQDPKEYKNRGKA